MTRPGDLLRQGLVIVLTRDTAARPGDSADKGIL